MFPRWPSEASNPPPLFISLIRGSGREEAQRLHSPGLSDWKEVNQRHPLLKSQDCSGLKQTWHRCCCLGLSSLDPAASWRHNPSCSTLEAVLWSCPDSGSLQFLRCWCYFSFQCSYICIFFFFLSIQSPVGGTVGCSDRRWPIPTLSGLVQCPLFWETPYTPGETPSHPRDPELREHTYLSPALPRALGSTGKCLSHRERVGVCVSVPTCVGN